MAENLPHNNSESIDRNTLQITTAHGSNCLTFILMDFCHKATYKKIRLVHCIHWGGGGGGGGYGL